MAGKHSAVKMRVLVGIEKKVIKVSGISMVGKNGVSNQKQDIDLALIENSKGEIAEMSGINMVGVNYTGKSQSRDTIGRNVYKMETIPRGLGLIINNESFTRYSRRVGSDMDAQRLKKVFERLHFRVEVHNDSTCWQMRILIKGAQQSKCHESSDAFVLIILSHGLEGGVICGTDSDKDGVFVDRDIVEHFNDSNCPALRGKPKMFFFNTCRGKLIDRGVNVATDGSLDVATVAESIAFDGNDSIKPEYDSISASWQDMLIASSSVDRHATARHPVNGPWFASALISQLEQSARTLDLQRILNNVSKDVMNRVGNDSSGKPFKQTPSIEYRGWTKQLYF